MSEDRPKRKVRTRGHVIADLAVNFVERQILLAGFTMERTTHDYGLDTHMTTYDPDGQVENETVWFQIKSTDDIQVSATGETVKVRIESADLRYWLFELMPVILVLYEPENDRGYWIEAQQYAVELDLDAEEIGETVTLHLPATNLFSPDAVREIRDRKEAARRALLRPGGETT